MQEESSDFILPFPPPLCLVPVEKQHDNSYATNLSVQSSGVHVLKWSIFTYPALLFIEDWLDLKPFESLKGENNSKNLKEKVWGI
jgi:hypothetical protein